MLKKISIITVIFLFILSISSFAYGDKPIRVTYNGNYIEFDQEPISIDGRVLVPLRKIFEAMGGQVDYDSSMKMITGQLGDRSVVLTLDKKEAYVNGEKFLLDVPAMALQGRTLVPVRFISESFGADVDWDGKNKLVVIKDGNPTIPIYLYEDTEAYQSLKKSDLVLPTDTGGLGDKIRFVAPYDGMEIKLEYGEYLYSIEYFRPITEILNISTKANTVYEMSLIVSEGIPQYRITASYKGCKGEWLSQYDGKGETNPVYINLSCTDFAPLTKESRIMDFCKGLAYSTYLEDAEPLADERHKYWLAAAYAITAHDTYGYSYYVADDCWYVEELILDAYLDVLAPDRTFADGWPDSHIIYRPERHEKYDIRPLYLPDNIDVGINYIEQNEDGFMEVGISLKDLSKNVEVAYVAFLQRNEKYGDYNPFTYAIKDLFEFTSINLNL